MKNLANIMMLTLILLTLPACGVGQTASTQITVEHLKTKLAENHSGLLLDVRTQVEIKNGTIPGKKVFVTYGAKDFREQFKQLDKSKKYYIYCQAGVRSQKTLTIMKELGFENVYNVVGGIAAWKEKGYKVD